MVDTVLPALMIFAVAASITPGPKNIMVMASGANFGLVRSVPHLFGISAGVFAIISLIGLGLMAAFDAFPMLQALLRIVSALCLIWLAWRIAIAVPPAAKAKGAAPFTFFQSAAFQTVNTKIWATGFSAVTLFATDRLPTSIILVTTVFAVIGFASNAVWAALGTALRHFMSGVRLRVFNIAAALLLIISLYPVLFA